MQNIFYIREIVHFFLHLIFPIFIAKIFFRNNWRQAYFLMLATMLVDVDHLFADPLFDPNRNSINFHPLHTYWAIGAYFLGVIFLRGNYRIIAVGLLFHMFTDFQDFELWKILLKTH
jgi:hypothetical protein